jgi:hypothetical protein
LRNPGRSPLQISVRRAAIPVAQSASSSKGKIISAFQPDGLCADPLQSLLTNECRLGSSGSMRVYGASSGKLGSLPEAGGCLSRRACRTAGSEASRSGALSIEAMALER